MGFILSTKNKSSSSKLATKIINFLSEEEYRELTYCSKQDIEKLKQAAAVLLSIHNKKFKGK